MAKSAFPMTQGRGLLGKLVSLLLTAAVIWMLIKYPHESADVVSRAWNAFTTAVSAIVTFLRQVFGH
jgi:hypothetical protein